MITVDSPSRNQEASFHEPHPPAGMDLPYLVQRIQTGSDSGMMDLYHLFMATVRPSVAQRLGEQDVEDRVHDAFLAVVRSIRQGALRDPQRLFGFIHSIARRQAADVIGRLVMTRQRDRDALWGSRADCDIWDPEEVYRARERGKLVRDALSALEDKDHEVLRRFYLDEESVSQICQEMSLTETQFRLLKSRAKARFGKMAERQSRKPLVPKRPVHTQCC